MYCYYYIVTWFTVIVPKQLFKIIDLNSNISEILYSYKDNLGWLLIFNFQIFDFSPFHFFFYYIKLSKVKFGQDDLTPSRAPR